MGAMLTDELSFKYLSFNENLNAGGPTFSCLANANISLLLCTDGHRCLIILPIENTSVVSD